MDSSIFSVRLRKLREEKKLLQKELAAKIGVKTSTLASWEIGHRTPEFSKAEALADFFNCTLDYLFGRSDFRHSNPNSVSANNSGPDLDPDDEDLKDIINETIEEVLRKRKKLLEKGK